MSEATRANPTHPPVLLSSMLYYPKIPGSRNCPGGRCIAFEKWDGTNLHWVWDRDFGWHAFGTRRDRFNMTPEGITAFTQKHMHLSKAVGVFREALADGVDAVFREREDYATAQEGTVFTEFFGPNSFAGLHKADDPKELRLFDVELADAGLVAPEQFVADFGHLNAAEVVYRGKFTGQFAEDVRRGNYDVDEGVVCKGVDDRWMVKIKTYAYLERLKEAFGERWEDYWE